MKELKKLSLNEEVKREAEQIEKEVESRSDLDDIEVSDDMEASLFNKIQEYEYDKRLKKVHYRRKRRYIIAALAAVIVLVCGSVMTGVGSKLRSAADVFDAIGNKFNKVKGFTDTCSKYLNKGADMLTQFEKIRVEFVQEIGADVEKLSNKFADFFNAHHIDHVGSIDDIVDSGNVLPNLMDVASDGGFTETRDFASLVAL